MYTATAGLTYGLQLGCSSQSKINWGFQNPRPVWDTDIQPDATVAVTLFLSVLKKNKNKKIRVVKVKPHNTILLVFSFLLLPM